MKLHLSLILSCLVFLCGCSDWLNVDSKTEISSDELFKNERGFVVALNGMYSTLASNKLYGGELTFGAIEVMSHGVASTDLRDIELEKYNYQYTSVERMIASIWDESYNLIANLNEILDQADKKGADFFTGNNYELIKGQALAARAMLHFNVVRLFAPHPGQSGSVNLPYYEKVSHIATQVIPFTQFMNKVISDFSAAKQLLAINDTLPTVREEMKTLRFANVTTSLDKYIGYRFNYYSVSALLARAAMWAGDQKIAYDNATEIIKYNTNKLIVFTTPNNINREKCDRVLSDDLLFALYRQTKELEEVFNSVAGSSYILNYTEIFPQDEDDLRKKLIETLTDDRYRTYKYTATHFAQNKNFLIPMIRLSEMYYIAAEVISNQNLTEAIGHLNYVRKQRGVKVNLNVPGTKEMFIENLIDEVRRETIGEGQLFFYYKRLNHVVIDEEKGDITLDKEFTFPIPETEVVG